MAKETVHAAASEKRAIFEFCQTNASRQRGTRSAKFAKRMDHHTPRLSWPVKTGHPGRVAPHIASDQRALFAKFAKRMRHNAAFSERTREDFAKRMRPDIAPIQT